MQIRWNGLGSFTIIGKPISGEVTLVTDPFDASTGLRFPRALSVSLIVQSHDSNGANNSAAVLKEGDKPWFLVHHAGEYEVRGVFVIGIHAPLKDGTPHSIYRLELEDMSIGFLVALDRPLTDKEMEYLGAIDILIIPAGGKIVLSPQEAAAAVAQIEPRLIIASYVNSEGLKTALASAQDLAQEIGCATQVVNTLKITKSALPQDDELMILLSRS